MKEKINTLFNEIIEQNKLIGFTDSRKNIVGQVFNQLTVAERFEIMTASGSEKYKTCQGKLNACIKYMLSIIGGIKNE